ncbi:hypothetical protein FIBSPDRAFT_1042042 [Athelia psychrophila]|uniref:Uncharacterized protein n=1 Tax=Athelia psychrophila TaxID=1759441 RepID=A0A166N2C8_9AGAM|nr:hypothetical protein FIBSPDRAFT_1042042 [Fibularhizoctonia sp. CBS 109695]
MSTLFPETLPDYILPPFETLLIKGDYHPSAPIHLCLSHTQARPHSRALLLTPSRATFKRALQEHHDDWLSTHSGHGRMMEVSRRIDVFYPPSPAHLALMLFMLRVNGSEKATDAEMRFVVRGTPVLLVLLEPSAYFSDATKSYTVSSYLTMITQTLACLAYLSGELSENVSFALFDSGLDQLKLPVLPGLPQSVREQEEEDAAHSPRVEPVAALVQKYFQWVGVFDRVPSNEEMDTSDTVRAHRLRLYALGGHTNATPAESSNFLDNILTPGSSLNPTFLLIVDAAFTFLLLVFIMLAYLTGGSIHVFALMGIEFCLWASVKWFVNELKNAPVIEPETAESKKDL